MIYEIRVLKNLFDFFLALDWIFYCTKVVTRFKSHNIQVVCFLKLHNLIALFWMNIMDIYKKEKYLVLLKCINFVIISIYSREATSG